MGEQYGLPTLILAAAAVVISAVSLMSLFVFRYRDRIELQVTGTRLEGDSFIVTFRNRGGTAAHMKGVYFNGGGAWINLGLDPLAGRSEGRIGVEIPWLRANGRIGQSLYVMDASGRRSPDMSIPDDIRAAVNGPD
jgi:hypothetical protein